MKKKRLSEQGGHTRRRHLMRAFLGWLPLLVLGGCGGPESQASKAPLGEDGRAETNLPCTEISVHCGKTPSLRFDEAGLLWAVFEQEGHVFVTTSRDRGMTFSDPTRVQAEAETIETNGENRPKIAFGTGGEIYLSWTRKLEGRFTGDIRFTRSLDGGVSFEPVRTINDDGLVVGHRFESLHVAAGGDLYLVWIDKRDREEARTRDEEYIGAAIYYAVSRDRGASFAIDRRVSAHACECCRIAITEGAQGGAAVLWRHIFDSNTRDHAFAELGPQGVVLQSLRATQDGWQIDGCPHHGPAMVPAGEGTYHLVWFTAADHRPEVYYGRFDPAVGEIAHVFHLATTSTAHPHLLESGSRLGVVWKEMKDEEAHIYLRTSGDGGESWSDPQSMAVTVGPSDHPFLIAHGGEVSLSWHTLGEGLRVIPVFRGD